MKWIFQIFVGFCFLPPNILLAESSWQGLGASSYDRLDVKVRPLKIIFVGDSHMVGSYGYRLKSDLEKMNTELLLTYPRSKGIQFALIAKSGSRPANWLQGLDQLENDPHFSKKGNWLERINSLPSRVSLSSLVQGSVVQDGSHVAVEALKPDLFVFEMGSNLIPSLPSHGVDFTNPLNVRLPMSHYGTARLIQEVQQSVSVLSTYGNPFAWVGVPSPRFPDVQEYYPTLELQRARNGADFLNTILCQEGVSPNSMCDRHIVAREFISDGRDGLHFNSCAEGESCASRLWAKKTIEHLRQKFIEPVFRRR